MILELDGHGPRYLQIARSLRAALLDGVLPPGARLPATRELAAQLSCSRNTVVLAYDELTLEGYAVSRARSGTFVSTGARPPARKSTALGASARLSPAGQRLVAVSDQAQAVTRHRPRTDIDFMYGLCEPDRRMLAQLKRRMAAAFTKPSTLLYGDPAGEQLLRQEIARRLHSSRGLDRSADNVVVTTGAQQALDLCARLLLHPGDRVIVEDPGYEAARSAFLASGATLVPVRVDDEGLAAGQIPHEGRRARLVYVTPSHQFPTGVLMPASRRHALVAWARRHQAYILEDDYDGDLRHRGLPVRALAGVDPDDHVIYCGTFAKALFPSLRLGFVSLPSSLARAAASAKWLLDRGTSSILQTVVAHLLASGEYDRHLRRMQRHYAARRQTLVTQLVRYLGSAVEVHGDQAGLHVFASFRHLDRPAVEALVTACRARNVGVYDIGRHALLPMNRHGLLLGYGLLTERDISEGVARLAAAYRTVAGETSLPQSC